MSGALEVIGLSGRAKQGGDAPEAKKIKRQRSIVYWMGTLKKVVMKKLTKF